MTSSGDETGNKDEDGQKFPRSMSAMPMLQQWGIDKCPMSVSDTPRSLVLASGTHRPGGILALFVDSNAVVPILSKRVAQEYL